MIGKGQVYKISSEHTDKCYIGSTELKLEQRFATHKCQKYCMSKVLFELGECKIEALEVLYNITKQELKIKEQYYLDLLKDKVVNKKNAHSTQEQKQKQRKEQSQRWRNANPDKVAKIKKQWKLANPDKVAKHRKKQYEKSKVKMTKENNPV